MKREIAREGYAAIESERDAPVREIRVERPLGSGFVPAGELADGMYWSAARRGVMISGWVEESGVRRWNFAGEIHWAVKKSFLDLMAEAPDPVIVRAGMLDMAPVPEDQAVAAKIFADAHKHWQKYVAWQKSWQKNEGVANRVAKSGAKSSRRIPPKPVGK